MAFVFNPFTGNLDIVSDESGAVALNTTHRTSDGTDHSDVVLNNTHRADNTQAHSDYLINNGNDTTSGSLTMVNATLSGDLQVNGGDITSSTGSILFGSTDIVVDSKLTSEKVTLDSGTMDVTFESATSLGGQLALQNNVSDQGCRIALYTKDNDRSDSCFLETYVLGTPSSQSDREKTLYGWNAPTQTFQVKTNIAGSGVSKQFDFFTSGNEGQICLETDGDVTMDENLAIGETLMVTGKITSIDGDATTTLNSFKTIIWAEESGAMSTAASGGLQYSFGNGNVNMGIRMAAAGQIFAMSIAHENSAANTGRVRLAINGVAQSSAFEVKTTGIAKGGEFSTFSGTLPYNAGDVLNFITTTSEAGTDGIVMAMWCG